jgi:hypothetical protein
MECRYLLDRRGTLLYFQSSFGNGGTSIKLLDGELRSFVFVDISQKVSTTRRHKYLLRLVGVLVVISLGVSCLIEELLLRVGRTRPQSLLLGIDFFRS